MRCKKGNRRRGVLLGQDRDQEQERGQWQEALVFEANCVQNKSTRVVNRSWNIGKSSGRGQDERILSGPRLAGLLLCYLLAARHVVSRNLSGH